LEQVHRLKVQGLKSTGHRAHATLSLFFSNYAVSPLTYCNYNNGHLEILAELFNAEAELELARGNRAGSLEYSRKSLILFRFIDAEQKIYTPERLTKMEAISKRIESLENG
jgi:hypothetical protein